MTMAEDAAESRLKQDVDVFVPVEGGDLAHVVDPASGIVGEERDDGTLLLYYEGDRHDAVNILTFADRVSHAHGRWAARYPTTAVVVADADDVVRVGRYDPTFGRVTVTAEAPLLSWLGVGEMEGAELETTSGKSQRRRDLREVLDRPDTGPGVRHWARREARKLGLR